MYSGLRFEILSVWCLGLSCVLFDSFGVSSRVLFVPGKKREVMFEVVDLIPIACFLDSEFFQSFVDICVLRFWKMFSLAALGCVCVSLSLFKRLWP